MSPENCGVSWLLGRVTFHCSTVSVSDSFVRQILLSVTLASKMVPKLSLESLSYSQNVITEDLGSYKQAKVTVTPGNSTVTQISFSFSDNKKIEKFCNKSIIMDSYMQKD